MLLMPTIALENDWDLLNRAARDPSALETLFLRHRDYVYRLAWSRLRDSDRAEDITQEVFYRIAGTRRRFFKGAQFRTWLYRVVSNQIADQMRHSGRMTSLDSDLPASGPSPEAGSDLSRILDAVQDLPERQREVLVLRLLEGFSTEETARALKIGVGSVKTHLHRATQRLRNEFSDPTHSAEREESTP